MRTRLSQADCPQPLVPEGRFLIPISCFALLAEGEITHQSLCKTFNFTGGERNKKKMYGKSKMFLFIRRNDNTYKLVQTIIFFRLVTNKQTKQSRCEQMYSNENQVFKILICYHTQLYIRLSQFVTKCELLGAVNLVFDE